MMSCVFLDYPKMIRPKSTMGSLHLTMVFLEVHTIGKEMLPVSAKIVNSEKIS